MLLLVIVQIILVCCCIFVLKSYCGLPFQICKIEYEEKFHSLHLNSLVGLTVRRACRSLLSDNNSESNQQQMGAAPSKHSAPSAPAPAPASYHHQQIPTVLSHTAMPYPVQLDQHLVLPPYPSAIYPHEMGFIVPPPLPHSANLETIVTVADPHKITTPRK